LLPKTPKPHVDIINGFIRKITNQIGLGFPFGRLGDLAEQPRFIRAVEEILDSLLLGLQEIP